MSSSESTQSAKHGAHPRRPRRGWSLGLLLVALTLAVAACGSPSAPSAGTPTPTSATLAEGSSERVISVGNTQRSYRVYRPQGITTAAPLVMVFHGYTWNAARTEDTFGWNMLADAQRFIVLYPEGLNQGFNAGGCCGISSDTHVDDVSAALAMVDDVAKTIALDTDRLFVTGFSNGGAMTYRMACETDRFAAFGPVAGGLVVDCKDGKPASILHLHGLADTDVPVVGDSRIWRTPVDQVLADWRTRDDCAAPGAPTTSGTSHRVTATCAAGREVGLITIDGLRHAWPTAADGLDATSTLWAFFAKHPRGH